MSVRILIGDCVTRMRELPDNSVDSVVCDPPYHLTSIVKRFGAEDAAPAQSKQTGVYARSSKGFMGQTWDGGDVAFRPETWAEVLRVLKPGGHLLAFSGTRTYHRMAVAIEDAGFEVRDMIAWHYGSGFPKSLDVSKAIDKAAGAEREVLGFKPSHRPNRIGARGGSMSAAYTDAVETLPTTDAAKQWEGYGTALKPATEPICLARKPLSEKSVAANVLKWGTGALNVGACRISADDQNPVSPTSQYSEGSSQPGSTGGTSALREACPRCHSERTGFPASAETGPADHNGLLASVSGHGLSGPQSLDSQGDCLTCRGSDGGPAHAALAGGQASLLPPPDADSARALGAAGGHSRGDLSKPCADDTTQDIQRQYIPNGKNKVYGENMGGGDWSLAPEGRWPANLVHDGSDEVVAGFPDLGQTAGTYTRGARAEGEWLHAKEAGTEQLGFGDSGSAARFFYCAKATTDERGEGNNHPTVKPVALMRWLVRLVTPKGGTVLDPFMGSGSTGLACDAEQFDFIGCELSPEYAAIAERRIRDAAGMFADVKVAA